MSLLDHALEGSIRDHDLPQTLSEQVEHLARFLRREVEERPEGRLVLIGHSIGAYICLAACDALGQRERGAVAHVLSLMPFLSTDYSVPGQARISALTRSPRLVQFALWLATRLPWSLQRGLVRAFSSGMDEDCVEVRSRPLLLLMSAQQGKPAPPCLR